jgi:hypothetical protein
MAQWYAALRQAGNGKPAFCQKRMKCPVFLSPGRPRKKAPPWRGRQAEGAVTLYDSMEQPGEFILR